MTAIRCAVYVFKTCFYCIPHPASSMDRVAGMVADWFSLHERLIFQSVSKNISFQLEEGGSNIATRYKETVPTSLKAEVVVLIHVVECASMLAPSPSLPSSVPQETVLSVADQLGFTTSPKLSRFTLFSCHCLLCAAEAMHFLWCSMQTFDASLSTRFEKVSGRLDTTIWPSTPSNTSSAKKLRALAELAPAPTVTTLQWFVWRSSLRFAQRRRAMVLCPHRHSSRSVTFTTS